MIPQTNLILYATSPKPLLANSGNALDQLNTAVEITSKLDTY
jgi:hypothetical protein